MKKTVFPAVCILAAAASTVYLFTLNYTAGMIQAAVLLCLCLAGLIIYAFRTARLKRTVRDTSKYFEDDGRAVRPFPVVICTEDGSISWFNEQFEKDVLGSETVKSGNVSEFIGDITTESLCAAEAGTSINYAGKKFTVYADKLKEGKSAYCLFFIDNTEIKKLAEEYKYTRPVVLQMKIDNLDEVYQTYKNSECEVISGELEHILEQWASKYPSFFRRVGSGKYVMVMEERGLTEIMEKKFDILKKIRDYKFGESPIEITLSIGVGYGGSYVQCDEFAKQAIEMSQSRGGDQATVNHNGDLQFFGGLIQGNTKNTKIKARLMASAFADHIENADAVFSMGHCFSDLDSVGSAVGVCEIAKALGKPYFIICDKEKSMAKQLIEQLSDSVMSNVFITGEKAAELITSKSLLVVVDTHRASSLEYPELFVRFENVAVIDHHRRTADYINTAVLYYDEPNASSACEMVTELIQYTPAKVELSPLTAEALLSGIMLDTRNFVLSTGSRTFEAAAYLKGIGADTVSVKQLFAFNFESYKHKNAIVSTAVTYKGCAIAVATEHFKNIRIVASQVANELLNVAGVKSSYVLFEENDQINISARSLGEMNVQVIMEYLGGGGHLTMAATQISGITMGDAVVRLENAIEQYIEENK
ncbi:MAG: DHH family phosphoesterase [Clostridiales bacterium]|nr:DHH family phosphoesterase [Clostridiales bacterium]